MPLESALTDEAEIEEGRDLQRTLDGLTRLLSQQERKVALGIEYAQHLAPAAQGTGRLVGRPRRGRAAAQAPAIRALKGRVIQQMRRRSAGGCRAIDRPQGRGRTAARSRLPLGAGEPARAHMPRCTRAILLMRAAGRLALAARAGRHGGKNCRVLRKAWGAVVPAASVSCRRATYLRMWVILAWISRRVVWGKKMR